MPSLANAEIVTWTYFNGRPYWVDVQPSSNTAQVWFRVRPLSGSYTPGDFPVMRVRASATSYKSAVRTACHVWQAYDDTKTVIGCASTIGSAACIVATPASGGTAALVCGAVVTYTASKGLTDCIFGVSGRVAEYLGAKPAFRAAAYTAKVGTGNLVGGMEQAIGLACDDVLAN